MYLMRLFITNLLIAAMLVMPLHAWSYHMQCGCVDRYAAEATDEADGCCNPSTSEHREQGDEQPEPRPMPCDQQDCPSSCCSVTLVSAFVIPMSTSVVTVSGAHRTQIMIEQSACASPHLLRLKRPPKSA